MDVFMEVAFMPSVTDFGFPWWVHLRIIKAFVLRGIMAYLDHPSQRPVEPGILENNSMSKSIFHILLKEHQILQLIKCYRHTYELEHIIPTLKLKILAL